MPDTIAPEVCRCYVFFLFVAQGIQSFRALAYLRFLPPRRIVISTDFPEPKYR